MNELNALYAFLAAAALAWVLTPPVRQLAFRVGALDEPTTRGLHDQAMPRLGGVAIFLAVLVPMLIWLPLNELYRGVLTGAGTIVLVGVADDIWGLNPFLKLIGQIGAALIPVLSGVAIDHVTLPFVGAFNLGAFGGVLTVVALVGAMNVVNFIDGVDGLAAGVCTIGAATFAVIALSLDRVSAGILAAAAAGAAAGFLRHNFHPASIFMGDTGSNLLGYLLAVVAVQGVLKTAAVVALVFPLVILAVPILDSSFVIAKRLKYREPIYQADRWHFHHRLTNIGFSQRKTVLYLYAWTLILAGLALALRFVPYSDHHGHLRLGWTLVLALCALLAIAASIYLVLVLEILKLKRFRWRQLRRSGKSAPVEAEVDASVQHELETGEFEVIKLDDDDR